MTKNSTDAWIARQNASRDVEGLRAKEKMEELKSFTHPRFYSMYDKMLPGDIVISIEHCHSCHLHNATLRHKPEEYVKNADQFLSMVGQMTHECCIKVRLGLSLYADLGTGANNPTSKRVGAFVQIAYKDNNGRVHLDLLYSKLVTRRWPSKPVIGKRLKAFIAKHRIETYLIDDSIDYTDSAMDENQPEGESYPVGAGRGRAHPWE